MSWVDCGEALQKGYVNAAPNAMATIVQWRGDGEVSLYLSPIIGWHAEHGHPPVLQVKDPSDDALVFIHMVDGGIEQAWTIGSCLARWLGPVDMSWVTAVAAEHTAEMRSNPEAMDRVRAAPAWRRERDVAAQKARSPEPAPPSKRAPLKRGAEIPAARPQMDEDHIIAVVRQDVGVDHVYLASAPGGSKQQRLDILSKLIASVHPRSGAALTVAKAAGVMIGMDYARGDLLAVLLGQLDISQQELDVIRSCVLGRVPADTLLAQVNAAIASAAT